MPRVVYSLHLMTERQPGAPIVEFVAPLDRQGRSANFRPLGKPRVVDLRPGDMFRHRPTGQRHQIAAMSAYRQAHVSDEAVAARGPSAEGYIVCEKNVRQ